MEQPVCSTGSQPEERGAHMPPEQVSVALSQQSVPQTVWPVWQVVLGVQVPLWQTSVALSQQSAPHAVWPLAQVLASQALVVLLQTWP